MAVTKEETRAYLDTLEDGMSRGGWKPTREVVKKLVTFVVEALAREEVLDTGLAHLDFALSHKAQQVDELRSKIAAERVLHQVQIQNIAGGGR